MLQTIVAQATATGLSGLAVIRVSGADAFVIADRCFVGKKKIVGAKSHTILYGHLVFKDVIIDDVTVSIFHKPHSYTGENTVEFGTHGGAVVPIQIINALIDAGCKYAEPGEFTRRAFINGKINLVQAEAVADIIHSISVPSATISAKQLRGGITTQLSKLRNTLLDIATTIELEMDFAEEDIKLSSEENILNNLEIVFNTCSELISSYTSASILREGFVVAIVGKPNAGKSTLFNSLLNAQRAIVSEIPGTTRDYISEVIYLNDIPIKIIDTAGLRETQNIIEIEGIEYAYKILEQANLILFVNDISVSNDTQNVIDDIQKKYPGTKIILVNNKIDLNINNGLQPIVEYEKNISNKVCSSIEIISISAKKPGTKIIELKNRIGEIAKEQTQITNDILLNERQYFKLIEIIKVLDTAKTLLAEGTISEILSIEIRNVGRLLGELTGQTWSEEVLNNVFARFCIGK
jgi:tRNA modification GTPase